MGILRVLKEAVDCFDTVVAGLIGLAWNFPHRSSSARPSLSQVLNSGIGCVQLEDLLRNDLDAPEVTVRVRFMRSAIWLFDWQEVLDGHRMHRFRIDPALGGLPDCQNISRFHCQVPRN